GELAKSALSGIASAIDAASQEHAYTASGSDGFFIGNVIHGAEGAWGLERKSSCLIFWVPDTGAEPGKLSEFAQEAVKYSIVSDADLSDLVAAKLPGIGLSSAPLVYVEIA